MNTVFSLVLNFRISLRRLHRLNIQAVPQADVERTGSGRKSSCEIRFTAFSVASISNIDIKAAIEYALSKAKETLSSLEMDRLLKKHSKWDNVK